MRGQRRTIFRSCCLFAIEGEGTESFIYGDVDWIWHTAAKALKQGWRCGANAIQTPARTCHHQILRRWPLQSSVLSFPVCFVRCDAQRNTLVVLLVCFVCTLLCFRGLEDQAKWTTFEVRSMQLVIGQLELLKLKFQLDNGTSHYSRWWEYITIAFFSTSNKLRVIRKIRRFVKINGQALTDLKTTSQHSSSGGKWNFISTG